MVDFLFLELILGAHFGNVYFGLSFLALKMGLCLGFENGFVFGF